MILKPGEKVHVIHRQLFEADIRRHFAGVVETCEGPLVRVKGYLFALDAKTKQFVKRETSRTRIISLDSVAIIVNVLPDKVDMEKLNYKSKSGGEFLVTDGSDWLLEISHL